MGVRLNGQLQSLLKPSYLDLSFILVLICHVNGPHTWGPKTSNLPWSNTINDVGKMSKRSNRNRPIIECIVNVLAILLSAGDYPDFLRLVTFTGFFWQQFRKWCWNENEAYSQTCKVLFDWRKQIEATNTKTQEKAIDRYLRKISCSIKRNDCKACYS